MRKLLFVGLCLSVGYGTYYVLQQSHLLEYVASRVNVQATNSVLGALVAVYVIPQLIRRWSK